DSEGEREGKVGDQESKQRVEEMELIEKEIERHDDGNAGQHAQGEYPQKEIIASVKVQPRQWIGRDRSDQDSDNRGAAGELGTIDEVLAKRLLRKQADVVIDGWSEDKQGNAAERIG